MRIDAFNKVSQLYNSNSVKSTAKTKGKSFSDTLELSQTGKDLQVAKQIVARTPDVREAKVNDIRQRMASGTYNVSNEAVADKLVDGYFSETI